MTDNYARQRAESVFNREQRREREIAAAIQLETQRHEAAIENMKRLRALRLSKGPTSPATSAEPGEKHTRGR